MEDRTMRQNKVLQTGKRQIIKNKDMTLNRKR